MNYCSSFKLLFKFHVVLLFKFQVVLLFRLRIVFRVSSCELLIKTEFQVIGIQVIHIWCLSYEFNFGLHVAS